MEFEKTLAMLSDLKNRSELFIALTPPFFTTFEIDREILKEALEQHGIMEAEFKREAFDVNRALFSILSDDVEPYIAYSVENSAGNENEDAGVLRNEYESLVSEVKDKLVDDRLQQRYDLKKSSKAPGFTSVDWDIKIKHFDAHLDSLIPLPYATFRIAFQKDFGDSPLLFLGGRAMDSVQMNFTVDEIEHLQRVLSTAQRRLRELEDQAKE